MQQLAKTAPTTPPTEQEIGEIQKMIADANLVGSSATSFSAQRLRACIDVGAKLNEWKKRLSKGSFTNWLDQYFPDLVERTRQRWMRLAFLDRDGKINFDDARSLRHAYQLAELLPDSQESNAKGGSKKGNWLVHLARLVANLQHIDVKRLSPAERNLIYERLKPVLVFIETVTPR